MNIKDKLFIFLGVVVIQFPFFLNSMKQIVCPACRQVFTRKNFEEWHWSNCPKKIRSPQFEPIDRSKPLPPGVMFPSLLLSKYNFPYAQSRPKQVLGDQLGPKQVFGLRKRPNQPSMYERYMSLTMPFPFVLYKVNCPGCRRALIKETHTYPQYEPAQKIKINYFSQIPQQVLSDEEKFYLSIVRAKQEGNRDPFGFMRILKTTNGLKRHSEQVYK